MASARFTAGRALPGALPPARAPRRQCATHRLPRALPDASQLVAVLTDASHTVAVVGTSPTVTNAAQRLSDVDPNTDVTPVVGGLAAGVSLVGGALYTAANGRLSAKVCCRCLCFRLSCIVRPCGLCRAASPRSTQPLPAIRIRHSHEHRARSAVSLTRTCGPALADAKPAAARSGQRSNF